MRYVRTLPGPRAHISTAVFCDEVIKFFVCSFLVLRECLARHPQPAAALRDMRTQIFCSSMWLMAVPALLYAVQKQLLYLSIQNLQPAVYQVTNQLKVVSAALFSVLMLGRRLTLRKCAALLLLVGGVTMVQLSVLPADNPSRRSSSFYGLITGVGACVTSGLAGVYTEMMLKRAGPSMW